MSTFLRFVLVPTTLLLSGAALAQTSVPDTARSRPFRTQVQTQLSMVTAAQSLEEQRAQGENARRSLYEVANRECNTLRDVFGGECRLMSLNVTSSVQQRQSGMGIASEQLMTSANATYEVSAAGPNRP